jgi:hypothetical protein
VTGSKVVSKRIHQGYERVPNDIAKDALEKPLAVLQVMALPQPDDQMPHTGLLILQSTALLLALRRVSFPLTTSISVMYIHVISPGLVTVVARHPNPNAIAIVLEATRDT